MIGICGDIGSGKDTVANHLEKWGFKKIGVANKLKATLMDVLGIQYRDFYGTQVEKSAPLAKFGLVPRVLGLFGGPWPERVGRPWLARWVLEFVGTECFRSVYPETWIDHVVGEVMEDRARFHYMRDRSESARKSMGAGHALHVVPDVRFPNEFTAIRAAGGVIWRTIKTGEGESERTGHASDEAWRGMEVDADLIAEPGDLPSLRRQADDLVEATLRRGERG